jgi:hypothetical protein
MLLERAGVRSLASHGLPDRGVSCGLRPRFPVPPGSAPAVLFAIPPLPLPPPALNTGRCAPIGLVGARLTRWTRNGLLGLRPDVPQPPLHAPSACAPTRRRVYDTSTGTLSAAHSRRSGSPLF